MSGSADSAAAAGAAGVHLPQRLATAGEIKSARTLLGPDALIGVSAHNRAEATAAQDHGADYVSMSPVYLTDSKPGYGPALEPEPRAAIPARWPVMTRFCRRYAGNMVLSDAIPWMR